MSEFQKSRETFPRCLQCLALGLSLMAMLGTASAKPAEVTDAEMKLLPRYCADTMGFGYGDAYTNTSPRAGYWISLMGNNFWNMHHYCWAKITMNRSQRAGLPAQVRRGLWESARGDYGYVIIHSKPDFIMLPEIYTQIGDVELLLNRPDKANEAFTKARDLKPDYWPAYSLWAEFLIRTGKRVEAKQLIQSGLEYSPAAKVLLEQYKLVGGKASEIIPKTKNPDAETNDLSKATTPADSQTDSEATPEAADRKATN